MCFSYNKDKKTQSIYLNCKLDSESVGKHVPLQGNAEVFISQYSNGRCLNGNIADLKVLLFASTTKEEVFDRMMKFPLFAVLPSKVESHPARVVPDSASPTSALLSRLVDRSDDTLFHTSRNKSTGKEVRLHSVTRPLVVISKFT